MVRCVRNLTELRGTHVLKGEQRQSLQAKMESRAERQFAKIDWPTPEMLRAAHRARAKVLSTAMLAFGSWLKRRAGGIVLVPDRHRQPVR